MKYRIEFWGCPNGAAYFVGAVCHVPVSRVVEADNPQAAALMAYDTHEHIGGTKAVKVISESTNGQ